MLENNQKIPEGWSVKKLEDCFSFLKTPSYSRAETTDGGEVRYIHYGDIHTKYHLHVCPTDIDIFVSAEQARKGDLLKTGDLILLDASEDYEGTTKCIELVDIKENDKVISGLHTLALRDNTKNFANGFRAYITSIPFVKDLFWKQVSGFKVYGVSKDNLKKLKLIFPPLAEQEKIAEILGTWNEVIEKLSSLIEQKKLLKKGLMQKLLTGKVRLPGFTQPWKEVKLGEITEFISGYSFDSSDFKENGVPLIRISNIKNDKISLDNDSVFLDLSFLQKYTNYCIKYGDLLLAMSGATTGKMGVNKSNIPMLLNQRVGIIRAKMSWQSFLNQYLMRFNYKILQMSYGGAQPNIGSNDIKRIKLYIPSDISEQQAIADVLSTADDEIDLLNKKLILFKEQKKGLMQQLLTGNIRVKVN